VTSPASRTMQALRYHVSAPRFLLAGALGARAPIALAPLRLERVREPTPPPGWRRIDVRLAGVCGSDLSLLFGTNSPRLTGFFSFPAVLGHEILGEVDGSRVVVDPLTACRERDQDACAACRRGDDHLCDHAADGTLAPGMIGYNRDLPGGWGERVVAHPARVHGVADSVSDARAVLAEPFAVAWRGARIALAAAASAGPRASVLVIGGGTIGLSSVAALRHAGFEGLLHVVARYPRQREAVAAMGADRIHGDVASASTDVGARSYRAAIGPPAWRGGFDVVIDAAGSRSSLDAAAWAAREGGTVVLLGAPGNVRHDFSPHWFREVTLVGSYVYTAAEFAEATEHLASVDALDALSVERYPLARYRDAITVLRARQSLKVAFDPRA
jgi:threonine dehydrogenase-like Zn-dependent dehydrogenase